jgi:hypothetical protein
MDCGVDIRVRVSQEAGADSVAGEIEVPAPI